MAAAIVSAWWPQRPLWWPDSETSPLMVSEAVATLWALALEIDERVATRTGEMVCRACGGSGEVWDWAALRQRTARGPCPCAGPTRPTTVSLARLVRLKVTLGDQTTIGEQWAADIDAMEANGWRSLVLPSTKALGLSTVTPAWMCRWWQALRDWSVCGAEPMVDALSTDLLKLIPDLKRRERAKHGPVRLWYPPGFG